MSMTLKRHINGQVVPIKLSLLDAFRGVPPPRKKKVAAKMRSSATQTSPDLAAVSKVEDQTAAPAPATAAPAEPEPATTGRDSDNSIVTKQGDDEAHTFTAMDDTKLIELKAAGKTWKEIVAVTKKSQSALKGRYKEIGPKANSGPGGEGGGNGAPDGKQKRKNSNAKAAETEKEKETDAEAAEKEKERESDSKAAETEKEKGSDAKAAERKDESGAETAEKNAQPQTQKAANKGEKGKRDVHKPTETAIKSTPTAATVNEATANRINLADIAGKYENDKWRFAASKYYDLTGIRISSKTAQEWAEAEM